MGLVSQSGPIEYALSWEGSEYSILPVPPFDQNGVKIKINGPADLQQYGITESNTQGYDVEFVDLFDENGTPFKSVKVNNPIKGAWKYVIFQDDAPR